MKTKVIYESAGQNRDFSAERSWLEHSHILDDVARQIGQYRLSDARLALRREAGENITKSPLDRARAGAALYPRVEIRARSCGIPNAFYLQHSPPDPGLMGMPSSEDYPTIVVCYELVKFLQDMAEGLFADAPRR